MVEPLHDRPGPRGAPRVAVVERADAEQRQDRDAVDGGGQGRARPDARRGDRHEHHAGPDRDDERPEVQPAPHPRLEQRSAGPGGHATRSTAPGARSGLHAGEHRHGGVGSPAVGVRDLLYSLYERRLSRHLRGLEERPRHVAVMLDGNRRWAREAGFVDVNDGHRVGAAKIADLLAWCEEEGVEVVTLFLLSTDNLSRPADELDPLLEIIAGRRGRAPRARRHRGGCGSSGRWTCCHPASRTGWRRRPSAPSGAGPGAQRRGRLRRSAGDRRRRAQAAAAPRRGGHVDRGARRGARRRPHRPEPLHLRPARPRPRHPHVGGAAAVGLPAVAVGALGVLVLRGLLAGFRKVDFLRAIRDYAADTAASAPDRYWSVSAVSDSSVADSSVASSLLSGSGVTPITGSWFTIGTGERSAVDAGGTLPRRMP